MGCCEEATLPELSPPEPLLPEPICCRAAMGIEPALPRGAAGLGAALTGASDRPAPRRGVPAAGREQQSGMSSGGVSSSRG